ncbi:MAG: hypothetical protein RIR86_2353 [Acidobacteriota bacterium]
MGEGDERISDLASLFIELVLTQLTVAEHVDPDDEQAPLIGKGRIGQHLDHGLGHVDPGGIFDRLPDAFRKSSLVSNDLQGCLARQFLDRQAQRTEQGEIGGAHGKEDRHSQRDADDRQHGAQPVRSPLAGGDLT